MPFESRMALTGSHRDPVVGAAVSRPIDKNEAVHATVVLRRKIGVADAHQEFGFTGPHAVSHRTREEYGLIHGSSNADITTIEEFAHEFGIAVTERSPAKRSVVLSGTAEAMQTAFGTTLTHYDSPQGSYRGRTGSIMLPEELQPMVTAVLGLDNRPMAKPHLRRAQTAATPPGALTPLQVAKLYNFPTGMNGAGQTIGIVELGGGFRTSDLKTYFRSLGLKPPAVKAVSVDGGLNKPGVKPDEDGEVMLDIEVAGAVAPGATIVVYFAPNTDQGFHDAIATAVHDQVNKPSVISISWGGPEESWPQQSRNAMLAACTDAAGVGVTITAASGDDGAGDGVSGGKLHVDLPACLPPVLGCGGTRLNTSHDVIASEVVWNELGTGEGSTGGGVSRFFPLPDYHSCPRQLSAAAVLDRDAALSTEAGDLKLFRQARKRAV
jgi:kumamolisin